MTTLEHSVSVYVPSVDRKGDKLIREQRKSVTNNVRNTLTRRYGGTTSFQALGSYSNGSDTVTETVTIVKSFVSSEQLQEATQTCIQLAEIVKAQLEQDSVAVQIDERLLLVD